MADEVVTMPDLPVSSTGKASIMSRMAGTVARHSFMSLAIIIVLIIIVIGMMVYYRGFLFLGPYASGGKKNKKKPSADGDDAAGEERADPETERLIDSINAH